MNKEKYIEGLTQMSQAISMMAEAMAEETEKEIPDVNPELKEMQVINTETLPLYISINRACEISGFKKYFIERLCRGGDLLYTEVGKKYYIQTQSLLEYCNVNNAS